MRILGRIIGSGPVVHGCDDHQDVSFYGDMHGMPSMSITEDYRLREEKLSDPYCFLPAGVFFPREPRVANGTGSANARFVRAGGQSHRNWTARHPRLPALALETRSSLWS